MSDFWTTTKANLADLKANPYPGRGIVLGMTPDGARLAQVYWIMGRSENSRNRVFEICPDGSVRTKAFDESKVKDPSLIIYRVAVSLGDAHILTNGDQTDTIAEHLRAGGSFESALREREFEPDAPNYTPRISGLSLAGAAGPAYRLSILKTLRGNPAAAQRQFFEYSRPEPGAGHCIHTYQGDGDPLPSFVGEPRPTPLLDGIDETAALYWAHLNVENRISLLVKHICLRSGQVELRILNKNLGD